MNAKNAKITQVVMHVNTVLMGVGFYMLLPLLNPYLYNVKMFTAVIVGYIASSRVLSSDICMIFGGSLGNTIGCKKTMVMGCAARVVAFVMFGYAQSIVTFMVAGALIGLGGALFLPACSAYYDMMSTDENRAKMFSIQQMLDNSGNIIGPTVGSLLVAATNFKMMCLLCAAIYIVSIVMTLLFLPELKNESGKKVGLIGNIVDCAKNTKFVFFLIATSTITFIVLQRDLTIPVKLATINPGYSVGFMYTLAAIIGVAAQLPMVSFFKRHFESYTIYGIASFLYTAGLCTLGFARNIPMLYIGCIVFGLGQSLYMPVKAAQVAEFAGRGKVAGYYGFQGLVGVLVSLLGNTVGGILYDYAGSQSGALFYLPWVVFAIVGGLVVLMFVHLGKKQKAKTN